MFEMGYSRKTQPEGGVEDMEFLGVLRKQQVDFLGAK